MLPTVSGPFVTAKAISVYGYLTVFLSFLGCFVLPEGGLLYGMLLLPYNSRLLQLVSRLRDNPEDLDRAKGLFRWSILYMFGVCVLLVISRLEVSIVFNDQLIALIKDFSIGFS